MQGLPGTLYPLVGKTYRECGILFLISSLLRALISTQLQPSFHDHTIFFVTHDRQRNWAEVDHPRIRFFSHFDIPPSFPFFFPSHPHVLYNAFPFLTERYPHTNHPPTPHSPPSLLSNLHEEKKWGFMQDKR